MQNSHSLLRSSFLNVLPKLFKIFCQTFSKSFTYLGNVVREKMVLAHVVDEAAEAAEKPDKHEIDWEG